MHFSARMSELEATAEFPEHVPTVAAADGYEQKLPTAVGTPVFQAATAVARVMPDLFDDEEELETQVFERVAEVRADESHVRPMPAERRVLPADRTLELTRGDLLALSDERAALVLRQKAPPALPVLLVRRSDAWIDELPPAARAVLAEARSPKSPYPKTRRVYGSVARPRQQIPSL